MCMTCIVGSLKQGCLMADRLVVKKIDINKTIKQFKRVYEPKIKYNKNKTFAYVFDMEQEEKFVPFILDYLTRVENGTLEEEGQLKFECNSEWDIKLYVLSKKALYIANLDNKSSVVCITSAEDWAFNFSDLIPMRLIEVFDKLTVLDLFKAVLDSSTRLMSSEHDVAYQKDLMPIAKVKVKKAINSKSKKDVK